MFNFEGEFKKRIADGFSAMTFGVSYLDDVLNGIRPCDLTILAARTGAGKTELATHIAVHNCPLTRVALIALETERFEIERRIKYHHLSKIFFEKREKYPKEIHLNFTDWLFGKFAAELSDLEAESSKELATSLENLYVYSPTIADFTKNDFTVIYEELCRAGYKLIIFDHIHYLNQDSGENEYDHVRRVMIKLRELINRHEVPIIALSHLRKESMADKALLPRLEDLHGSSEITKQANHVISIAPIWYLPTKDASDMFEAPPGSTVFKILKTRTGHNSAGKYASIVRFDLSNKSYDTDYLPYVIDKACTKLFPIGLTEFERWMKNARPPKN